jgi:hypothetical protein
LVVSTEEAHAAKARERAWRLRRAAMTAHPLATIRAATALDRSAATALAALSLSLLANESFADRTPRVLADVSARHLRHAREVWCLPL